jgi:hypothetical protein
LNTFRITIKQQLILLSPMTLVILILYFGGNFYLKMDINNPALLWTLILYFLIDMLPTMILHIQYYLKNRHATFIMDSEQKRFSYEAPNSKLNYTFDDIASLEYYRPYGIGSGWNSFGQYRYYKIMLKDKTEVFITCLMVNDIENTLENLFHKKAIKHFKFINLVAA